MTPEGSAYRTLTIVESGGGVVDHDGAFRFPDGTYAPACWGYMAAGGASGAYWIDPTGSSPFKVYCEMDTDGGGWTLVDNDASTTSHFSRRELGANTNLTATRGSILPAYTWSSAPRLLCKASYYTGTLPWVTLEPLDATGLSYPTCCGKNSNGGVCPATCTEGQAGADSGHWAVGELNGNTNQGVGSWIYTGSGRFGSVWIGDGSDPTCACDYHETAGHVGLGEREPGANGDHQTCSTWVR